MKLTTSKWICGLGIALLVAGLVAGCRQQAEQKPDGNGDANGAPQADTWKGEMSLEVADWDEIQSEIRQQTQQGKVVVVDFWSTWCEPCLKEFPNLVRLQKRYGEKIAAISVNLNYAGEGDPEELRDEVRTELEKHDARFQNFISSVPDEVFYQRAEFAAVPAVFVYDPSGNVTKFTINTVDGEEISYDKHVEPLVAKLVKQSNGSGAAQK